MIPKDSRRFGGRKSREAALITIGVSDLPAPRDVRFVGQEILSLTFDTIAECQEWAQYLGVETRVHTDATHGRHYVVQRGSVEWLGWDVNLFAAADRVNEIDDSLSTPEETVYAPCRPIGCDAGLHIAGCVYAEEVGA